MVSIKYTVWGGDNCPYCIQAKNLLDQNELAYDYVDVKKDEAKRAELKEQGFRTIPQIWHGDHHVGGFTDLVKYIVESN